MKGRPVKPHASGDPFSGGWRNLCAGLLAIIEDLQPRLTHEEVRFIRKARKALATRSDEEEG